MQVTPEQAKEMLTLIQKLCAALGHADTLNLKNKNLIDQANALLKQHNLDGPPPFE
jgi:hypothetical protein